MKPQRINLLPAAYRRRRGRARRLKAGIILASTILIAEFCVGIALRISADETELLLAETAVLHTSADEMAERLAIKRSEAVQVRERVEVSMRLRTKHRWSRLLATLGEAAPDGVVLTAVSTIPPRWSRPLYEAALASPSAPSAGGAKAGAGQQPIITGVMIRGYALSHRELSTFMSGIQSARAFATIDLKDARRDQYLGQEAIYFELDCRW